MTFVLGKKSLANLTGVHPDLIKVVRHAITITTADFSVNEGLRTLERQKKLFAQKASMTLDSRHLTGHAVDLVPYIEGELRWDWPLCYTIADAVRTSSIEMEVPVIWGGVWDIRLNNIAEEDLEDAVAEYVKRMKAKGKKKVFTDGPHYELDKAVYR